MPHSNQPVQFSSEIGMQAWQCHEHSSLASIWVAVALTELRSISLDIHVSCFCFCTSLWHCRPIAAGKALFDAYPDMNEDAYAALSDEVVMSSFHQLRLDPQVEADNRGFENGGMG